MGWSFPALTRSATRFLRTVTLHQLRRYEYKGVEERKLAFTRLQSYAIVQLRSINISRILGLAARLRCSPIEISGTFDTTHAIFNARGKRRNKEAREAIPSRKNEFLALKEKRPRRMPKGMTLKSRTLRATFRSSTCLWLAAMLQHAGTATYDAFSMHCLSLRLPRSGSTIVVEP